MTQREGKLSWLILCALAVLVLLLSPLLAAAEAEHHQHGEEEGCLLCAWIQQAQSVLGQGGLAEQSHPAPLLLLEALVLWGGAVLLRPATLIRQKVRMDD